MNSIFEMFSIGIGPSSSHTVGPMKAANVFMRELRTKDNLSNVNSIEVTLYGSLASTGKGHGTDHAVIYGLLGYQPDSIDIENARLALAEIKNTKTLLIAQHHNIFFEPDIHIEFKGQEFLKHHPNGIKFQAFDKNYTLLQEETFYSTGGGFICTANELTSPNITTPVQPYPFNSFNALAKTCNHFKLSIVDLVLANESAFTDENIIHQKCNDLWLVMNKCVVRGLKSQEKTLPGGLNLNRRAPKFFKRLIDNESTDSLNQMDWLNVFALAVSEENARGNRVVTAPTNGAAGIIPSVLTYINQFHRPITWEIATEFFAVATAIGSLYKMNASISGAEVGCQGEVGVACSMAAGALAHVLGGDIKAVENAAEIAMEHNLGMTCDPIGGLVQVPCIERNAIGAVKAVNAARMAVYNPNDGKVSLDTVIKTMYQTGMDMGHKYKETSAGGLAINVAIIEC
jgi:L-serine dehydratase